MIMKRTDLLILRFVLRLPALVLGGLVLVYGRNLFADKMAYAACLVLILMLGLCLADVAEYFLFKRIAPSYRKFSYRGQDKWLCSTWRRLRRIPVAVYFLMGLLWKIFAGIITPDLSKEGINNSLAEGESFFLIVLLLLLFAPLVETLFFQVLPIEISNRVTKKCTGKPCVLFSIVVSALLFALEHRFSPAYMCYAFVLGLYLAFFYSYISKINGNKWGRGFVMTALLHLLFNSLALLAMVILNSQA